MIDSVALKKRLKQLSENPKTHPGLKQFYSPDNNELRTKLINLKQDLFFLSILADELLNYIADSLTAESTFHTSQIEALIAGHANYIFTVALEKFFNFRDEKTNIWSRRALEAVYQQEIQKDQESQNDHIYVFVFFDIDDFKQVNDNYSHQIGDQQIIALAEAAKEVFGAMAQSNDVIARLSGDEFGAFFKRKAASFKNIEDKRAFGKKVKTIFEQIQTLYQQKITPILREETNSRPFILGATISVGFDFQLNPRDELTHYLTEAEKETREKKLKQRQQRLQEDLTEAANPESN